MCLAELAATYVTNCCCDHDDNDVLPSTEPEASSSQIIVTDGFGKMIKERLLYDLDITNKDGEPSNWYRAKLMLY